MIALMASDGKVCLQPRSGKQYSLQRAVAQLGSALEWGSRGRGFKSRRPDVSFMSQTDFKYDCCFYGQSVSGPELLTLAVFLAEPDKYAESQSVVCHTGRFRHRVSKSVPLLTGIAD